MALEMLRGLARKFKPKKAGDSDDFIRRIRSLVIGEGMLRDGNIDLMISAIKNMPKDGSVVEIGSHGGLSTNLIVYLIRKYERNNIFFNCDAWIYEGYKDYLGSAELYVDGRDDVMRKDYPMYMKNAFINATKFLSSQNLPHSLHMYSDTFFEKWSANAVETDIFGNTATLGGPISFAYIDGGHSYDVAWKDFNDVSKYVLKNGYVLLDDSADGLNLGSSKMMAEIKKDPRYMVVAKNPNYMLKKVM